MSECESEPMPMGVRFRGAHFPEPEDLCCSVGNSFMPTAFRAAFFTNNLIAIFHMCTVRPSTECLLYLLKVSLRPNPLTRMGHACVKDLRDLRACLW